MMDVRNFMRAICLFYALFVGCACSMIGCGNSGDGTLAPGPSAEDKKEMDNSIQAYKDKAKMKNSGARGVRR